MNVQFRLKTRMAAIIILTFGTIAILGTVGLYQMSQIRSSVSGIANIDLPLIRQLSRIETNQLKKNCILNQLQHHNTIDDIDQIQIFRDQLSHSFQEVSQGMDMAAELMGQAILTIAKEQSKNVFVSIGDRLQQLKQSHAQQVSLFETTLEMSDEQFVQEGNGVLQQLIRADKAFIQQQRTQAQDSLLEQVITLSASTEHQVIEQEEHGILLLSAVLVVGLSFSLLFTVHFAHAIVRPLFKATSIADSITRDEFDVNIPSSGIDEIQKLMASLRRLVTVILERKDMEQMLVISEKMSAIGRMSAGVIHELNNPMASASLGLQTLKTLLGEKPGEEISTRITSIENNLDRASIIIRELLIFSRSGKGGFLPVNMREEVEGALVLLAHRIKSHRIEQNWEEIPDTYGDIIQLEHVFINLINNALDSFGSEVGHVIINGRMDGDMVEVSIEDNGVGIQEENLSQVFEPFFTTKEIGHGTGLGLAICISIIAEHDGTLGLTSKYGHGTRVVVRIPYVSPP
ncbi:MAG: MCP four helix bundle domain-containing protein [Magnetococcales bacterium]|nr:MCP four helix bundle domain-containing protein [Magnetococcales bacterium]